ncbi:hypothetical protein [Streptomyces sp. NPDC060198]|uniref:hypothetical protein n=1 Tax=Streptomyces sp. NPDC060198 TaxID=3347070 RepID=UPI003654EA72
MVPSAQVFFVEVRASFEATARTLGLTGPQETEHVLPVSTYTGGGVTYGVSIDFREGAVQCRAEIEGESVIFTAGIEEVSLAAGMTERRGISCSARNLKQLRKSLQGQIDCVRRIHPLLSDGDAAVGLMRRAHAREWNMRGPSDTR